MSHTIREQDKLLARVRRIRGQMDGIERALLAEKSCGDVLHQIAAARGALTGLMREVMEGHINSHIADPNIASAAEREQGAAELVAVLRTYMK
ncbi:metal/formaldehyde-sensitive transcriptional repressor [Pollutimonas bauzanensis]|uniref:DNA-binding transcriptional regulator, FrmR family n=1 Tax=Pollutimonas bauzanensis TaxID=658167 RepID=A0A1M5X7V2_9BURK|nr:metal/formaldehyde-sensitive transcriptional repressor [Pollutimonas bauzanensis]SHH95648.1 DNA-binding transcriptional regulator, FrmR family [Pollutimonas bauzanensis]